MDITKVYQNYVDLENTHTTGNTLEMKTYIEEQVLNTMVVDMFWSVIKYGYLFKTAYTAEDGVRIPWYSYEMSDYILDTGSLLEIGTGKTACRLAERNPKITAVAVVTTDQLLANIIEDARSNGLANLYIGSLDAGHIPSLVEDFYSDPQVTFLTSLLSNLTSLTGTLLPHEFEELIAQTLSVSSQVFVANIDSKDSKMISFFRKSWKNLKSLLWKACDIADLECEIEMVSGLPEWNQGNSLAFVRVVRAARYLPASFCYRLVPESKCLIVSSNQTDNVTVHFSDGTSILSPASYKTVPLCVVLNIGPTEYTRKKLLQQFLKIPYSRKLSSRSLVLNEGTLMYAQYEAGQLNVDLYLPEAQLLHKVVSGVAGVDVQRPQENKPIHVNTHFENEPPNVQNVVKPTNKARISEQVDSVAEMWIRVNENNPSEGERDNRWAENWDRENAYTTKQPEHELMDKAWNREINEDTEHNQTPGPNNLGDNELRRDEQELRQAMGSFHNIPMKGERNEIGLIPNVNVKDQLIPSPGVPLQGSNGVHDQVSLHNGNQDHKPLFIPSPDVQIQDSVVPRVQGLSNQQGLLNNGNWGLKRGGRKRLGKTKHNKDSTVKDKTIQTYKQNERAGDGERYKNVHKIPTERLTDRVVGNDGNIRENQVLNQNQNHVQGLSNENSQHQSQLLRFDGDQEKNGENVENSPSRNVIYSQDNPSVINQQFQQPDFTKSVYMKSDKKLLDLLKVKISENELRNISPEKPGRIDNQHHKQHNANTELEKDEQYERISEHDDNRQSNMKQKFANNPTRLIMGENSEIRKAVHDDKKLGKSVTKIDRDKMRRKDDLNKKPSHFVESDTIFGRKLLVANSIEQPESLAEKTLWKWKLPTTPDDVIVTDKPKQSLSTVSDKDNDADEEDPDDLDIEEDDETVIEFGTFSPKKKSEQAYDRLWKLLKSEFLSINQTNPHFSLLSFGNAEESMLGMKVARTFLSANVLSIISNSDLATVKIQRDLLNTIDLKNLLLLVSDFSPATVNKLSRLPEIFAVQVIGQEVFSHLLSLREAFPYFLGQLLTLSKTTYIEMPSPHQLVLANVLLDGDITVNVLKGLIQQAAELSGVQVESVTFLNDDYDEGLHSKLLKIELLTFSKQVIIDCEKTPASMSLQADGSVAIISEQTVSKHLSRAYEGTGLEFLLALGLQGTEKSQLFKLYLKMRIQEDMCPFHIVWFNTSLIYHPATLSTSKLQSNTENLYSSERHLLAQTLQEEIKQTPFSFLDYDSAEGGVIQMLSSQFPSSTFIALVENDDTGGILYKTLHEQGINNTVVNEQLVTKHFTKKLLESPDFLRYQLISLELFLKLTDNHVKKDFDLILGQAISTGATTFFQLPSAQVLSLAIITLFPEVASALEDSEARKEQNMYYSVHHPFALFRNSEVKVVGESARANVQINISSELITPPYPAQAVSVPPWNILRVDVINLTTTVHHHFDYQVDAHRRKYVLHCDSSNKTYVDVYLIREEDGFKIPYGQVQAVSLIALLRMGLLEQIKDKFYEDFLKLPLYEDMAPWNIVFRGGKLLYIDYDTKDVTFNKMVPAAYQVMTMLMNYERTVSDFGHCKDQANTAYGFGFISNCVGSKFEGPCKNSRFPVPCGDYTCKSTYIDCLQSLSALEHSKAQQREQVLENLKHGGLDFEMNESPFDNGRWGFGADGVNSGPEATTTKESFGKRWDWNFNNNDN